MGIPNFECMNSRLSVFHTPQKFKPSPWKSNRAPQGKLIVFQASCFRGYVGYFKNFQLVFLWADFGCPNLVRSWCWLVDVGSLSRWVHFDKFSLWFFRGKRRESGETVVSLELCTSLLSLLAELTIMDFATSESAKNGDQIRLGRRLCWTWHT